MDAPHCVCVDVSSDYSEYGMIYYIHHKNIDAHYATVDVSSNFSSDEMIYDIFDRNIDVPHYV
jgi:hypothetical protein